MELSEFIAESLRQVIDGVKQAQAGVDGTNVNAKTYTKEMGGNIINSGDYGTFTRVDFDVAISAETSGSGGASLKVFSIAGIDAKGSKSSMVANRITFSVPVRLPDGDLEVAEEIAQKNAARILERKKTRFNANRARSGV